MDVLHEHMFSDEIESRIAEIVIACNKLPLDREQALGLAKFLTDEHFTSDEKEAWVAGEEKEESYLSDEDEDVDIQRFCETEPAEGKEESYPGDEDADTQESETEEKKE